MVKAEGEAMDWKHLLVSIMGTVDQALLLRHACLVTENRTLHQPSPGRAVGALRAGGVSGAADPVGGSVTQEGLCLMMWSSSVRGRQGPFWPTAYQQIGGARCCSWKPDRIIRTSTMCLLSCVTDMAQTHSLTRARSI